MVRRVMQKAYFFVLMTLFGCGLSSDDQGIKVFTLTANFSEGLSTWQPDFTGYPASWQDSVEYALQWDWVERPAATGHGKALMLSGKNLDEGLFMFIKTEVHGLSPNTEYALVFGVQLASDASSDIDGTNGSPGKSVYLKAGASTIEPKKIVNDGTCAFNLDKGDQESLSGNDMVVLGDIASASGQYELINRNSSMHPAPFIVRTDANGRFWLVIGTYSNYHGSTTIYYTEISVLMSVPD
jgi:hypothetical protein